jgi:hypothetical protein
MRSGTILLGLCLKMWVLMSRRKSARGVVAQNKSIGLKTQFVKFFLGKMGLSIVHKQANARKYQVVIDEKALCILGIVERRMSEDKNIVVRHAKNYRNINEL